MKRISVITPSHNYAAVIGAGMLSESGALLRSELQFSTEKLIVVSSENVWKYWGETLTHSLDGARLAWNKLLIADGEAAKKLSTVECAAEQLTDFGADRSSVIVALGGGVIGDLAGFLAAIYMRGIRVVQVPTTLLAQVDASVGGKTGVNLASGKNLIGSFHQPELVLIDSLLTNTLDDRELRAGIFEVIKCGIIADHDLFSLVESGHAAFLSRDQTFIAACIEASVQVKARVVSKDERESGLRRILNYGHTIGHALEADTHYTHFLHGEAVGWGMIAAAHIALQMKVCTEQTARRITQTVLNYGPLPPVHSSPNAIVRLSASDKKTVAGQRHFVLASKIGETIISSDVSPDLVAHATEHIRGLSQNQ
ncbi:MAG: 3-dehydroquinate synthase [Acidobacteriaceae bacterium]